VLYCSFVALLCPHHLHPHIAACIWGQEKKVALLLSKGVDPNYRVTSKDMKVQYSALDMTPLTWCVYPAYTDSVRHFLADSRTNVNLVVYQVSEVGL
jgi:hypothetical protein